jgi:cell pole-organizing protein PopZ
MMAQSSAQRDPSMEEILASIRRIIEEGEEVRQKPIDSRHDFEPAQIGPAANDAMRRPLSPAPEVSRDVPAVEAVAPEAFAPVIAEPRITLDTRSDSTIDDLSLSLEDFVIDIDEVRQVSDSDAEKLLEPASLVATTEKPKIEQSALEAVSVSFEQAERIEPEFDQPASVVETHAVTPERQEVVDGTLEAHEKPADVTAAEVPKVVVTAQISVPAKANARAEKIAPSAQIEPKQSMLSQAVERQVAASFTELTEALAASRRRPLDQIAEEMMRPMLQDWLDNNLPTLVERLVREEIERVARGAE